MLDWIEKNLSLISELFLVILDEEQNKWSRLNPVYTDKFFFTISSIGCHRSINSKTFWSTLYLIHISLLLPNSVDNNVYYLYMMFPGVSTVLVGGLWDTKSTTTDQKKFKNNFLTIFWHLLSTLIWYFCFKNGMEYYNS